LVTSSTSLIASDIPNLDWSKITTGIPTTLASFGITKMHTQKLNQIQLSRMKELLMLRLLELKHLLEQIALLVLFL